MAHIEEVDLTAHGIQPYQPIFLVITTDDSADGKSIFYLDEV